MDVTPVELARHGGTRPLTPPRSLVGDRFAFGLETPSVRNVTIDGFEVAQTITFSVRNKQWGTVESTNWSTTVETRDGQFDISMAGRFTSQDIDLEATIKLATDHDGSLTYSVSAVALRDFERARIGICMMHPAALAGEPLQVTTPDNRYSTTFPDQISASRAISDIVSLRHSIGANSDVIFEFEGELFEFEDQRNWTDNSYKTFCTPLSLPWPVNVTAGDIIEQSLRISTEGTIEPARTLDRRTASTTAMVHVDLDADGTPLPSIGVLSDVSPEALRAAAQLNVSHVRISLDARTDSKAEDLIAAVEALNDSPTQIELEIIADSPGDLPKFHDLLAVLDERVRSVFVFDRKSQITSVDYAPAIEELRQRTDVTIGGGSGSNFGAINFHFDRVAFDSIDALAFPMSPQVHYTDLFSVIENVDAQSVVANNGERIAGGRPLSIGPITLLPRRAGEPLARDHRSDSLFCAAWTVASLEQLIPSGVEALSYHKIGGDAGIGTEDGRLTPTYHLLAELGELAGADWLPVEVVDAGSRVGVIALKRQSMFVIIIANVSGAPIEVNLDLAPTDVALTILDETTYDAARIDRANLLASASSWNGNALHLLPFAIATLKVTR